MEEPIATPVPSLKPPNDKLFKISLIIIGLLIVIGLFFNVYLLLKKEKTAKISVPIPTAIPTIDPTANWKTYTNEKYGFEFRYPPISEPEEYQSKEAYYIPIVSIELSMSGKLPPQEQIPPEKISLSAIENIDIYETMAIDLIAQREVGDDRFKYTIKKIPVNNYETAQVDLESDSDNLKYYIKSPDKNLIIVATSSSKSKELIDQILSTFKFTDSASETANWKTYTNDLMKYSFSYPSDWSVEQVGADVGVNIALIEGNNNRVLFLISTKNRDNLNLGDSYKAKSCFEMSCGPILEQNENIIDKSIIKVGGQNVLSVTTQIHNENKKYYFFEGNNMISMFRILTSNKKQLLAIDQILSTFKFLP